MPPITNANKKSKFLYCRRLCRRFSSSWVVCGGLDRATISKYIALIGHCRIWQSLGVGPVQTASRVCKSLIYRLFCFL